MRILIAGQTYVPALNGQAIFTSNLAEGLHQRGHEVLMVIPSLEGSPYSTRRKGMQIEAVRAIPLTFRHRWAAVSFFPGRRVECLFDTFAPDLVHVQDHYPLCSRVVEEAIRRDLPLVGTNHFLPENVLPYLPLLRRFRSLGEGVLWHAVTRVFNRLDHVVAPSATAAEILQCNGITVPVSAISCGVDLDQFRPNGNGNRAADRQRFDLDPAATLLLFVGRIDKEKQLDLLVRALHRLRRRDLQLAIVGNGEASSHLQQLKETLQLDGQVQFTGAVPTADLVSLLNAADIFTMPSDAELLSMATLEAMACGRPVLAARARALPELVTDGVNGYLFRPGDVQDAATHITKLLDERHRWPAMSRASRERAERHGLDRMLDRYEAVYRRVRST